MIRRISIILFLLLNIHSTLFATTRRVLFLGNSYIYTNNLPLLVQQIATSMGDTLIYDENTIGGYTLQAHSTDVTSINKINAQAWDVVILQEQSQRPAFDPSQVATDTYPYAKKLDSMIRNHRPCTETMFFMTWGYKNGDAGNCAAYPPICTYLGMQQRLRESYLQMAQDNNAIVSPVGAAWKQVRDSFPSIDLYSPDESHPSISGTYLAACVFYASIFHKNPIGTSITGGVAATNATNLKRIAGKIVLDSFSKWNQYGNYTYANFSKSLNTNTVTLSNTSVNATNYYWTFGDGGNSNITSPSHTYAVNGKYYITLVASNSCFSESKKDSINIGTTHIINPPAGNINIAATGSGNITIIYSVNEPVLLELYDMNGKKLREYIFSSGTGSLTENISPGFYIYKYYPKNRITESRLTKISVY